MQTVVTLATGLARRTRPSRTSARAARSRACSARTSCSIPRALVLTWIAPIFVIPVPAFLYLGIWFVFQLVAGSASFTAPEGGGGVAYFAHIGGFVFGLATIRLLVPRRRPVSRFG